MAKRRLTVHVRIPPYRPPRNRWRRALYVAALEGLAKARVHYRQPDKLEVHLRLYMDHRSLKWNDVDNRLKDVLDMDALDTERPPGVQGPCRKDPGSEAEPECGAPHRPPVSRGARCLTCAWSWRAPPSKVELLLA